MHYNRMPQREMRPFSRHYNRKSTPAGNATSPCGSMGHLFPYILLQLLSESISSFLPNEQLSRSGAGTLISFLCKPRPRLKMRTCSRTWKNCPLVKVRLCLICVSRLVSGPEASLCFFQKPHMQNIQYRASTSNTSPPPSLMG